MRDHFFISLAVIQQGTKDAKQREEATLNVTVQLSHISAFIPTEVGCDVLLSNSLVYKTKNTIEDILKRTGTYGLMKVV